MKLRNMTLEEAMKIVDWRNDARETLRTPGFTNEAGQENYFKKVICDRSNPTKYFAVEEKGIFVGVCGLVPVQWENRIGEIALMIDPKFAGKGYGKKALFALFEEGFDNLNLENIFGEAYECNKGVGFWKKLGQRHGWYMTKLPSRKYWNGKYWDALYFNITKENWKEMKKVKPSTHSKIKFPVCEGAGGKYVNTYVNTKDKNYLDFTGANLTVILGYKDVEEYYFDFLVPSLPGVSVLELEAAKVLSKYSGTEHFRFFKNGHNAVDCAIRLARHILNKPNAHIFFVGFAGSGNEYAYTVNSNGVPHCNSVQLKHGELLRKQKGLDWGTEECDILVYESRYEEYASKIRAKIRICDYLKDGVNALWAKPKADLWCYGKSIANGYPISVLTGQDGLMKCIDAIFYSTTYGGENVGLKAMLETIDEFKGKRKKWLKLKAYADKVLPPWRSLSQKEIDKFLEGGIMNNGYWQIMTCHTKKDIDKLRGLYEIL